MILESDTGSIEYIIPFTTVFSIIVLVIGCTCWKKKVIKNDLLGLEGLVKLKNPDDNVNSSSSFITVEPKTSILNIQAEELKRASAAPHRSLPDIPKFPDQAGDTNSELYATVGDTDKVLEKPQGRSPASIIKTQPSVSQHSSLSQADDISSPYARVKSPHPYDSVRHTEHPYAQLHQIGSENISTIHEVMSSSGHQNTSQTLSDSNENIIPQEEESNEIPAASAIAGRIAASQDLPYMTPPIVQPSQQNFSGDSQDSSKGYTSISVREPLANIRAQTNQSTNRQVKRRETSDSHYATVSDDSDEMYAAIDDPNNRGDLYTSGSETYAQIQPPSSSLTVSVEINATPRSQVQDTAASRRVSTASSQFPTTSNTVAAGSNNNTIQNNEAAVGELKAQMHSRQASSSSCTSSVGNLGSPKPEKRQANSPLPPPPTPKSSVQSQHSSMSNLTSTSSNPSGRNSVASVIEVGGLIKTLSKENLNNDIKSATNKKNNGNEEANKKKQSPSKDLEGMYAKVMKKSKLSNFSSQNSSPIMPRKLENSTEPPVLARNHEIATTETTISSDTVDHAQINSNNTLIQDNNYETLDKRKMRHDNKDPGYETIPGNMNHQDLIKTKTESFTNEAGYESLRDRNPINIKNVDPGYEVVTEKPIPSSSLLSPKSQVALMSSGSEKPKSRNLIQRNSSEYDPNYEVLRPSNNNNNSEKSLSDDGYAKVLEKNKPSTINDGYSSIKSVNKRIADSASGYSTITETNDVKVPPKYHDYASIKETKPPSNLQKCNDDDENSDIYSSIPNSHTPPYLSIQDNYSTINETSAGHNQQSGGGSTTCKSPNNSLSITKNFINSPDYSSISETRTTPSTDSINSSTTDVHIGYNSLQNDLSYTNQSSNYESLTESESDPNYESVKYKISNENPYERLDDKSPDQKGMTTVTNNNNNNNHISNNGNNSNSLTTTKTTTNSKVGDNALEVSDYFQV